MRNNHSVLNTDRFDRRRFKTILEMSKNLQSVAEKGKDELSSFQPLMADMWASLYKMNPRLLEADEVDSKLHVNHSLIEQLMTDDSFQRFRETTKLDDLTSAIGTIRFSEKVTEWIEEEKQRNEQFQKALEEVMSQQKQLQHTECQKQEAKKELEQSQGDKQKERSAKAKHTRADNKVKQLHQSMEQGMQALHQQVQSMLKDNISFNKAMQIAQQETKQQKEELTSLLGSGAGNGEAELKKIPLRDQISLAEKLSKDNKLKSIAEWAGRFKAIARKKQKNKHTETIERSGVTMGTDIERLLPTELANYQNSSTKLDFLRRFAEKQTMMYAPEGKETLGKGPIICCLDQSGSMDWLDDQSKGFVLALMMIAKRQRRDFALVLFSTGLQVHLYEKGKISPRELSQFAQVFLGGGTRFDRPLEAVLEIVEKSRFKKGDVVFVTDGEARLSEKFIADFNKKKKEKQFNVLSLVLGQEDITTVEKFSEKIIHASTFQDEQAEEVFSI